MKYEKLFSTGRIGRMETKNRIVMPAMGVGLAGYNGEITREYIRYYEERAKGGCGLIITEITCVEETYGKGEPRQITITHPKHVAGLEDLARSIHKYDAKIFVQLHHPGRENKSQIIDGRQIVAPSPIICKVIGEMPRELTTAEVEGLVKNFITSAKMAQMAGIDGVELHGAHGYLINQFMSPDTNKRTDKYGGSFSNRMRFITEIITGIKYICGSGFPVIVRISADEFVGGELDLKEGVKIARYLESVGVDAINVSNGTYESMITIIEPITYPQGWKRHLAQAVKDAVKIPVIAVDQIKTPDFAEKLIEEGNIDFAAIGRGQLADPEWANKAYEERDKEIRPCISCRYCIDELNNGLHSKCAVNARMGRELEFDRFEKNGDNRCVVVIGGGPAGMEAARVLAIRGFKPVLFEKSSKLGGSLNLADKPNDKEKIDLLIENMIYQLKLLNVDVRLNTEATVDSVKALNPYAVIAAAGGAPIIPNIEGITGNNVCTYVEALNGDVKFSNEKVAVIGAGMTGCETAELLASKGCKVTLVEMLPEVGNGIEAGNKYDILTRLKKLNVEILPSHKLCSIGSGKISLLNMKSKNNLELPIDKVVLSLGVKPHNEMVCELKANLRNVKVVGDANRAGRISEAIREGFEKAFVL